MKKSLIVSYKGLTEDEQSFLYKLENAYFQNVEFNSTHMINFIKENCDVIGVDRGLDLYKFFTSHKFCSNKETYKNPIDLDVLLMGFDNTSTPTPVYYISFKNVENKYSSMKRSLTDVGIKVLENIGLIYKINPENYYFEIIKRDEDTSILYIKYQYIIGSRALAVINNNSFIKTEN